MSTSLTGQSVVLMGGRFLAYLMLVLHPVVLVRFLSKEDYGLYGQLMLLYGILLPLGEMGMIQGLYYFLPRMQGEKKRIVGQSLIFLLATGALCGTVIALAKTPIAAFFNNPEMLQHLDRLGIYCFFMIGSVAAEGVMIADGKVRNAALLMVATQLANSLVVVMTTWYTGSISAVMGGLVIFSAFRFLVQFIFLRGQYMFRSALFALQQWRENISFSFPIGISNVAFILQGRMHSFFISCLFTPAAFAVYSVGTLGIPLVGMITSSVSNVLMPLFSKHQKEGLLSEINLLRNSAIRKMNLVFFPMFIFFSVSADGFISVFFTPEYAESVPLFRLSLFSILLSGINNGIVLSAFGQTRFIMKLAFLRFAATFAVLFLFTHLWGMYGAVLSSLVTAAAFIAIEFVPVSRLLQIRYHEILEWKTNAGIFIVALLTGGMQAIICYCFPGLDGTFGGLILLSIVFAIAYLGMSLLFSTIRKHEIGHLLHQVRDVLSARRKPGSSQMPA